MLADNVYKADLHSHTTFSDGSNPLPDMVARHYELGFDIHAITDHSACFYGFTTPDYVPAMKLFGLVKNIERNIYYYNYNENNSSKYKQTEGVAPR